MIIPVYNASAFLRACIESALAQPETAEVIVIDDHSTDSCLSIAQNFKNQDDRVLIFQTNLASRGAGAARNIGIHQASNDWIAFLDADDYYLPGRFSFDEQTIIRISSCVAIYRAVTMLNDKSEAEYILHGKYQSGYMLQSGEPGKKVALIDFLEGKGLHLNGLTIRRDAILDLGGFDEELIQGQDSDFIFRFLIRHFILNVESHVPGAVYRIHSTNTIRNLEEGIVYRRQAARKQVVLSIRNFLSPVIFFRVVRKYLEYDILWFMGQRELRYKSLLKWLLLPVLLCRICIKTDTLSNTNR